MKAERIKLLIYGLQEKLRIKNQVIKNQSIALDEYRKEIKSKNIEIERLTQIILGYERNKG